jgi:hypothetical protein
MKVFLAVLLIAVGVDTVARRRHIPRPPAECPDCKPAIRSASVA